MGVAPLAVRLSGAGIDRHVEHELIEDLTFSSVMPGGYKACSFGLARPLTDLPVELYPYTTVNVYDQRTGSICWAGRLEIPGRGQPAWQLTAVGGAGHATDDLQPLVYVDRRMSEWERVDDFSTGNGVPNATVETTGGTGEAPGLRLAFARGMVVPPLGVVTVRYPHLAASGQGVGRVAVTHFEGLTTANAQQELVVRTPALSGSLQGTNLWNTSPQALIATRSGIGSSAYQYIDYRTDLTVGGAVGTDVTYSQTTSMTVMGTRLDASGAELVAVSDYSSGGTVPLHGIVNDLLGRMLPNFYPDVVSTGSLVSIDQLVYSDGVTPDVVLSDLMGLDPSMRWAAWEPGPDGRWRFVWDAWPTTVGLEADAADGSFTSPGAVADLYNKVSVKWRAAGRGTATRPVWSTYSQAVPLLDQAGVTRAGVVDLGSEVGSQAQADITGAAFLAAHKEPTNNGTLTVGQPIVDLEHARTLQPWEIVAGPLVRVRNVVPSVDALNVTDRDSTSVFRAAEVSYTNTSGVATLTLDSYSDSIVAALGALSKRIARTNRA